jgi:hypothetical protein
MMVATCSEANDIVLMRSKARSISTFNIDARRLASRAEDVAKLRTISAWPTAGTRPDGTRLR